MPTSPRGGEVNWVTLAFGLLDQLPGGSGHVLGHQHLSLREVDRHRVRGVAEHLDLDPVRLEYSRDQVGLQPLAPEHDLPALDRHAPHPRDGSPVAGPSGAWKAAAAIMAGLSVQSSTGRA